MLIIAASGCPDPHLEEFSREATALVDLARVREHLGKATLGKVEEKETSGGRVKIVSGTLPASVIPEKQLKEDRGNDQFSQWRMAGSGKITEIQATFTIQDGKIHHVEYEIVRDPFGGLKFQMDGQEEDNEDDEDQKNTWGRFKRTSVFEVEFTESDQKVEMPKELEKLLD